MPRYPRAAKANTVLDVGNLYLADLGLPIIANDHLYRTSVDMANGPYTLLVTHPADHLARNVVVTHTASDTPDTLGTVTVNGTDVTGAPISEEITPVSGTAVAGTKAFKTVTSAVQAGWAIDETEGTADKIEIGFGDLVGLPLAIRQYPQVQDHDQVFLGMFDGAIVAVTAIIDIDDLSECTITTAETFDGSKKFMALIRR